MSELEGCPQYVESNAPWSEWSGCVSVVHWLRTWTLTELFDRIWHRATGGRRHRRRVRVGVGVDRSIATSSEDATCGTCDSTVLFVSFYRVFYRVCDVARVSASGGWKKKKKEEEEEEEEEDKSSRQGWAPKKWRTQRRGGGADESDELEEEQTKGGSCYEVDAGRTGRPYKR